MRKIIPGFVVLVLCVFVTAAVIWHFHDLAGHINKSGQKSAISQSTQKASTTTDSVSTLTKSSSSPGQTNTLQAGPTLANARLLKQRHAAEVRPHKNDARAENGEGREQEARDEDEGSAGAREGWFYEQREYPLTMIPRMARQHAIEHMQHEEQRLAALKVTRAASTNGRDVPDTLPPWQSIGPKPIGAGQTFGSPSVPVSGRVTAIALDPGYNGTSNQILYVGGAQGGVWRSTDNGANWTPIMDDQPSMAIGAIAVDPNNPNTIYVGTGEPNFSGDSYYGAGLLKTTDGGMNWIQIKGPTSPNDSTIFAFMNVVFPRIVVDPTNSNTIYAVTNANGHTSGSSGGSGSAPIDQRGIWKSTDGGANWTNLNPLQTNPPGQNSGTDMVLDPAKPSRIYAAIQGQGVFLFDGTVQNPVWQELSGNGVLPTSGFTRVILAAGPPVSPSTESTVYAIFASTDSKSLLGIFRSTDVGVTWTKVNNPSSGQTNYNLALAVDQTNSNTIYYATNATNNNSGTVWRSTDGGQNYTDLSLGDGVSGGLHADSHVLVIAPSNHAILFTGNDGGIWRTANSLANMVSWTDLNPTLSITQFQGLALHPTDPNTILGGTQDNGTNLFSGQSSWTEVDFGDGGFTLIDQSNPAVMYHTFFNLSSADGTAQIGPALSVSGGIGWQRPFGSCFNGCSPAQGKINPADRVGFYAPMALNTGFTTGNGNVIYFGTNRLYRSPDRASTFTGLGASTDGFGTDLVPGVLGAGIVAGRLSAIAAFPFSNSSPSTEIVWVGSNTGVVQLTTNAGQVASATFTNVTKAPLPNRFVTDIGLDLSNPQRAIVTYSGFNANTPTSPGHVFITNDQGNSWTNISGNLPDVPVTSIALNPNASNTFYIGTDIGVFRTTDGGTTWSVASSGMPSVAVFMLRYHAASKTLVAATHGRGMFKVDASSDDAPANPVPAISSLQPSSVAAGSGQVTLTINGTGFVAASTVLWNGQSRAITSQTGTQLKATILSTDVASVGTATVTVSNPAPGGGVSNGSTFTINKANQTINFGALPNKTFGDTPFTVSATATSQLSVTFSIASGPATISGNTITIVGAGTVTVQADQAGNANFNAAPSVQQSFNIAKANQTISFGTLSDHKFGDAPFNLSATSTSGLTVSFSVISGPATINGNTVTLTGVGTVTIEADQSGDSNHNAAPPVQQSFNVAKAQAAINLSNVVQIFDGNPKSATVTTSPAGLSTLTVTYNGSNTAPTAVGNYTLVASLNNPTFQATNATATFRIVALSPTDTQSVSSGSQITASALPPAGPGITALLNHTVGGVAANLSVGVYSANPVEPGVVNANGGFVDVKVTNSNSGDTLVVNYYYPTTVTGANETALQLFYFNGTGWAPVIGSGGTAPVKDTTDNLDGTTSGGRFTVTLDNTSTPKVSQLTGTVFAATTAVMGDLNGDNQVTVTDLVLLANVIAGNITLTPVQKAAADVSQDGTGQLTITDLVTMANFIAGNIRSLPVGSP